VPTSPPYVTKRDPVDRLRLMEQVFVPRPAWVLSGSMLGWGDPVVAQCDAVVFLTLDPEVRLERLLERERLRYGAGAVDAAATTEFLAWARGYDDPTFDGRSRVQHEEWLAAVGRPVIRLDSDRPVEELRDALLDAVVEGDLPAR
jgi:thymidylate kinase